MVIVGRHHASILYSLSPDMRAFTLQIAPPFSLQHTNAGEQFPCGGSTLCRINIRSNQSVRIRNVIVLSYTIPPYSAVVGNTGRGSPLSIEEDPRP